MFKFEQNPMSMGSTLFVFTTTIKYSRLYNTFSVMMAIYCYYRRGVELTNVSCLTTYACLCTECTNYYAKATNPNSTLSYEFALLVGNATKYLKINKYSRVF